MGTLVHDVLVVCIEGGVANSAFNDVFACILNIGWYLYWCALMLGSCSVNTVVQSFVLLK